MALEFARFRAAGCRLLVAGRLDAAAGRFLALSDIEVPPELQDLLSEIPEADFRSDLSSTALRAAGRGLAAAAAEGAAAAAAQAAAEAAMVDGGSSGSEEGGRGV